MMKKIYLNLLMVTMMLFSLTGCIPSDKNPDVPWVEPPLKPQTGSGFLEIGADADAKTTKSSYNWSISGTTIQIDVVVDLDQYVNGDENIAGGSWEIGHFVLPAATVNDYIGAFVSELNETSFYAVQPDGTAVAEMTSYKPGMWIDADGYSTGWSTGAMFWQWYVWQGKTDINGATIAYDYDQTTYGNFLVIGSNPSNVVACAGETVVSKAKIVVGDVIYDWIVNVKYNGEIVTPTEDYSNVPLTGVGYSYPYSCGVSGENQFSWYADANGVYINADIYSPTVVTDGLWEIMGFVIDPEELNAAFSITTASHDISTFYPVEPDGTQGTAWTSYAPGQWVKADGTATDYSSGALYWQYQVNSVYYDGHSTEGLFLIGANPDVVSAFTEDKTTVVSKAKFFGKDWIVSVTYHKTYPTSGSGKVGAHTYTWELTPAGVNVVANCSASQIDDSWNWFAFALNEKYINANYTISLDDLSGSIAQYGSAASDGFYPVNSAAEKLTSWSSYGPGMWFDASGNPAAYDGAAWVNFWQYYTVVEHEYAIPNLFVFGKNPANNSSLVSGTTGTSKAILNGTIQWNVTLNVVN
jgi:hypothetical protein